MSTRDVVADNARESVSLEQLRIKAERMCLERVIELAGTATDLHALVQAVSLLAWAGQPGRPERPGP